MKLETLQKKALWVRQKSFQMCINAGKGHLGGAFSSVEILVSLYYSGIFKLSKKNFQKKTRDHLIFSKGHACLALYCILADIGFLKTEELDKYGTNGTILGGHPDHFIPGVEVSSGSLGHGLGIGCGIALSAKLNKQKFKTFVLLGDGECNEGSIWEAAAFARQQNLANLIVIIDNNKVAATDFTDNFFGGQSLSKKWQSFGWDTLEVDGHDIAQIIKTLQKICLKKSSSPLAIIAKTIKGKGVTFMENDPHWHHGVPRDENLINAKKELGIV